MQEIPPNTSKLKTYNDAYFSSLVFLLVTLDMKCFTKLCIFHCLYHSDRLHKVKHAKTHAHKDIYTHECIHAHMQPHTHACTHAHKPQPQTDHRTGKLNGDRQRQFTLLPLSSHVLLWHPTCLQSLPYYHYCPCNPSPKTAILSLLS